MAGLGDPLQRGEQRPVAAHVRGVKDIAQQILRVDAHQCRRGVEGSLGEGQVMPPIHLAPEDVQLELAVFRGERPRRHLLHQLLAPVAVFDELRDGDERQPVALLELDQLGQPGHRAVLV